MVKTLLSASWRQRLDEEEHSLERPGLRQVWSRDDQVYCWPDTPAIVGNVLVFPMDLVDRSALLLVNLKTKTIIKE